MSILYTALNSPSLIFALYKSETDSPSLIFALYKSETDSPSLEFAHSYMYIFLHNPFILFNKPSFKFASHVRGRKGAKNKTGAKFSLYTVCETFTFGMPSLSDCESFDFSFSVYKSIYGQKLELIKAWRIYGNPQ